MRHVETLWESHFPRCKIGCCCSNDDPPENASASLNRLRSVCRVWACPAAHLVVLVLLTAAPVWATTGGGIAPRAGGSSACVGDCGGDGMVTVDELLPLVTISLGTADIGTCRAGDANGDSQITINEILAAVHNALNGCRT